MGRQNLSIPVSPIWTDFSPLGLLEGDKACGGHMGVHLVMYLDDLLILNQGKEELIQLIPLISQPFEALGLVINQT